MYTKLIALLAISLCYASSVFALDAHIINMQQELNTPEQTQLILHFSKQPLFEIVRHKEEQVITVKFLKTSAAASFRMKQNIASTAIRGVKWLKIGESEMWLQIRLQAPDIRFEVIPQRKDSTNVEFRFLLPTNGKNAFTGVSLLEMTREIKSKEELFVFSFDKPFQYNFIRDKSRKGSIIRFHILNGAIGKGFVESNGESLIVSKFTVKKEKEYLSISFAPEIYTLNVKHRKSNKTYQLYITLSSNTKKTVAMEDAELEKRQQAQASQNKLAKPNLFVINKFQTAEELYRNGKFKEAAIAFRNISNYTPYTPLGLRANFRAADSFYEIEKANKSQANADFIVSEYNAAIASALTADKGFEDMPRAYYNMGKINFDIKSYAVALSYFDTLRQYYESSPFTQQAIFETGIIQLELKRYAKAEEAFAQFIQQVSNSPQVPFAYYKLGEVQFQQKHYEQAKLSFTIARKLDPEFRKSDAVLLFHIAETYYQTENYGIARELYEELDSLFPDEKFSNLVSIRIGDMLRKQHRYKDAIIAYQRATRKEDLDFYILAKMNIANLVAISPTQEAFKKSLAIYDYIIKNYPLSSFVEKAKLHKALLLGMFHYYRLALKAMEQFCHDYPTNIYVKYPVLRDKQESLLTEYLMSLYKTRQYMELLGVFEKYNNGYYVHTASNACQDNLVSSYASTQKKDVSKEAPLFEVADSYYQLKLYKQAITYLDQVLEQKDSPLREVALVNKGRAQQAIGNYAEAQKIYGSFIEKYPISVHTPIVKKLYGDVNLQTQLPDRVEKTINIYRQTIKDYENTSNLLDREIVAKTWYSLAKVYESIGKYRNAIYAYQQATSNYEHPLQSEHILPYIVESFYAIGELLFQEKSLHEALEAYDKAIAYYPKAKEVPWAKYHKAEILMEYGQNKQALTLLNALLKRPDGKDAMWLPLVRKTKDILVNNMQFKDYLGKQPSPAQ